MDVGTLNIGKLEAQVRTLSGKGWAHKLRNEGKIPAVCYGGGAEPIALSLDPRELSRALDPEKRQNTLITLTVKSEGKAQDLTVMLKDFQSDPIKHQVMHADFIRVDVTKPIKVTIPVILTGKAEGVKLGGILHQVFRHVEVECLPDRIPLKVEGDVSPLQMGQALHVSDIKLQEGVRLLLDAKQSIAVVVAPKAEKVEEEAAATAEVGAEGAAAAPAAEGAAAAAAPAAAAAGAKGGEDKKLQAKTAARMQAKGDKA
jgi:large subunit ribosomal protein L25